MLVAARFHTYCQSRGIVFEERFPYGTVKNFIEDNVIWDGGKNGNQQLSSRNIRDWYASWRDKSGSHGIAGAGQRKKIKKKCLFSRVEPQWLLI